MGMVVSGYVENGVIVLPQGANLPEGAIVTVSFLEPPAKPDTRQQGRVQVPLVTSARPGSVPLTSEQIAEILDQEDAAS